MERQNQESGPTDSAGAGPEPRPAPTQRNRRPFTRGLPIAVVLSLSFGALVGLALLLLSLTSYQVARRSALELIHDKAALITSSMIVRIRDYLDPARAELDFLARLHELGRLDTDSDAALGDALTASLAGVPQVSVIGFVRPDLRILRAFRARPGLPVTLSDWSDDPGVMQAMAQQRRLSGAAWGELFVAEAGGQTYLNVRRPIRDAGGELQGVLVAGVSLEELSAFVTELAEGEAQHPFILYDRDYVLAHARLREGYPGLTDLTPLPHLERLGDPVLAQIWSETRDRDLEADFDEPVELRAVRIGEETSLFLFRYLFDYAEKPMIAGVHMQLAEVARPLERLALIPLLGIAILVATLIGAALLGHRLAQPARRLAEAALSIRRFDIARAPHLGAGLFRELNLAGEAFNAMLDGLKRFETYVPRSLVLRLMRQGDSGGVESEERDITVLFTDIVGFTSRAERLPARSVAAFLNDHFTLISDCVEAEEGTIDKYIGDAVMAFWGAPERQDDHADRACRAALRIARALAVSNQRRGALGQAPVQLRIGIHSGPAIVGDIGAPTRVNYTVIGDTVNIAERLESLSRALVDDAIESCTLISQETAARLSRPLGLTPLGAYALAGRAERVTVMRLDSDSPNGRAREVRAV